MIGNSAEYDDSTAKWRRPATGERYFSSTYAEARSRFRDAVVRAGAAVTSFPIDPQGRDELAIDVAILGRPDAERTVVLSSGVHGVEGFVGSAIQLAWLEQCIAGAADRHPVRFVLLHAINPFGFAELRRANENNIDLNRNFHSAPEDYRGAPPAYVQLDRLLNPPSPPSPWEPFLLKALWKRYRVGMPALKQAIAGGQYEYPQGLFYGGRMPAASAKIVQEGIDGWVADSPHLVHLDFHTGLGSYGAPVLLSLSERSGSGAGWYAQAFGDRFLETSSRRRDVGYQASGSFGGWLQQRFGESRYRFVTVEFGTYHPIRVLAALRAENRAHFYAEAGGATLRRAKHRLRECFCPRDRRWRRQVLSEGTRLIEQAAGAASWDGA